MDQIVSFPKMGIEFSMDRVAFRLGSYPIYWYGILIATGFLLAIAFIYFRAPLFGLDKDRVFDVTFITIVLGIIGARLYYVVFSFDTYRNDLLSIFNTTKGGLAIYGGIIFGVLGVLIGCKLRKVKTLPMFDLTVGGLLIGQAIGRWGNFTNVEAFGGNTSLPWGMTSPSVERYLTYNQAALEALGMPIDPTAPVHPTFLYESLWCILGLIFLVLMTKRRKFDGQLTLFYFGWYGLGRFFIEGLRTDSLLIGNLRVSQIVAAVCFVVSTIVYFVVLRKIKQKDDPDYLPLYVNTPEAELIRNHQFYASDLKLSEKAAKDKDAAESLENEIVDTVTEKASDEAADMVDDDTIIEDATENLENEIVNTVTEKASDEAADRVDDDTTIEDATENLENEIVDIVTEKASDEAADMVDDDTIIDDDSVGDGDVKAEGK